MVTGIGNLEIYTDFLLPAPRALTTIAVSVLGLDAPGYILSPASQASFWPVKDGIVQRSVELYLFKSDIHTHLRKHLRD